MRVLAMLLNVALIATLAVLLYGNGVPHDEEAFLALIMFLAPGVSLIVLLPQRSPKSEGLIALYFKRRRLEESRRIRDLSE